MKKTGRAAALSLAISLCVPPRPARSAAVGDTAEKTGSATTWNIRAWKHTYTRDVLQKQKGDDKAQLPTDQPTTTTTTSPSAASLFLVRKLQPPER